MKRMIESRQRSEERLMIEIDGAAPATLVRGSEHASLVVNGLGDWTITLNEGASRTLEALATAYEADTAISISTRTNTSLQVLVTDLAAAAKDADCLIEICAWYSSDET